MKLLKIILPNMEERIVMEGDIEVVDGQLLYWQAQTESVYDGEEESFYQDTWFTKAKILRSYIVHISISKLEKQIGNQSIWAYSVVILDKNGDLVGMKVDTEEAPDYWADESVLHCIPIMSIATDIINRESL